MRCIALRVREAAISLFSRSHAAWIWDQLRSSFWFLPSAMTACAIAAAYALVSIDARLTVEAVRRLGWLYAFGPDGARAILSAIAGSMITVAALTFSITMLTLQLASSQFGPRLLRNVMRDRGNQAVLGTFVSTFVYCLLVLRSVRGTEEASNVPHLSVAVGVFLAVASLGVLIYFVHHIASTIRIETVLDHVSRDALDAIDRIYPDTLGNEPPTERAKSTTLPPDFEGRSTRVAATRSGYVQRIDTDALMGIASKRDLIIRVDTRPGSFVSTGDALLTAYPAQRVADADRALEGTVSIGTDRSPDQDVAHALRLLVEIAQRALSPGINDPTTALYCLDRLEESLTRLANRELPSPFRFDDDARLRVVSEVASFEDLAVSTLASVAQYGLEDIDVVRRLLTLLANLARSAGGEGATGLAQLAERVRTYARERCPLSTL